jgi:NADH-quinone oxidoreductase subunit K
MQIEACARLPEPGSEGSEGKKPRKEIMVPLSWYLALSAVIFTIGVIGVIIQRNVISLFMCIELMLNAVNLTLVAFSRYLGDITGQLFVFIVMAVAAAEAAVGLAIIISLFRNRETLNVDEADLLKL